MAKQAKDTFTTDLPDGTQATVLKGAVFPDRHPMVKHAPALFADFDMDDEKAPAKSQPAKAAAAPKVTRAPGKAS